MTRKRSSTAMIPSRVRSSVRAGLVSSLLSCVALLISAPVAHAKQPPPPNDFAVIFGTVWGPDDRPVYGVTVKIRRDSDKRARWEVHSNHLGEFEQLVPAGKQTYVLSADTKGLKTRDGKHLQAEPVTVEVEGNERVDTGVHLK
jgi:hypothetical protein